MNDCHADTIIDALEIIMLKSSHHERSVLRVQADVAKLRSVARQYQFNTVHILSAGKKFTNTTMENIYKEAKTPMYLLPDLVYILLCGDNDSYASALSRNLKPELKDKEYELSWFDLARLNQDAIVIPSNNGEINGLINRIKGQTDFLSRCSVMRALPAPERKDFVVRIMQERPTMDIRQGQILSAAING